MNREKRKVEDRGTKRQKKGRRVWGIIIQKKSFHFKFQQAFKLVIQIIFKC